jgi:hypothetical protein
VLFHIILCVILTNRCVLDLSVDYDEFKRRLGKAGLNVREFSELVRCNCNTVSNYASRKAVPTHFAVSVTLMSEMAEKGLDFKAPLLALDVRGKLPRGLAAKNAFRGSKQRSMFVEE